MASLIERDTGMSLYDIRHKSLDEIHRSIERKIGRKLSLGFEPDHQGRGSILIQENRIIWPEEIERY